MNAYEKTHQALLALDAWVKVVKNNPKDETAMECAEFVEETIKAALAEPRRNCDVGTAEEQIKQWEKFCQEHHEYWRPSKSLTAIQRCNCPCQEGNGCNYFIWAQMPYEDGEKGEVDDSKEILPPCTCGGEPATVERGDEVAETEETL